MSREAKDSQVSGRPDTEKAVRRLPDGL